MKKIVLNKKTLRVLTPADEAQVGGGLVGDLTDTKMPDTDYGGSGGFGGGFGGGGFGGGGFGGGGGGFGGGDFGGGRKPKGTYDTECRCPSMHSACPKTQRIDDPKCKVEGD
jgi:hypothetical protein